MPSLFRCLLPHTIGFCDLGLFLECSLRSNDVILVGLVAGNTNALNTVHPS